MKILNTLARLKQYSVIALLAVVPTKGQAETVQILDNDGFISVLNTPSLGATEVIGVRWGKWDSVNSIFTSVGNTVGAGYYDNDLRELSATISSALNPSGFASGSLLALAIYASSSVNDYSASYRQAILTNSAWVMPTLAFGLNTVANYTLNSSTTAVVGQFNYNSNDQVITLVPEPSTGALMMIGAAGLVALRRLRKV
jgi:hypothetical protein